MAYPKRAKKNFISSKNRFLKKTGVFICLGGIIAGIIFFFHIYSEFYIDIPSIHTVYTDWNNKDYTAVYLKTQQIIEKRPFDGTALALHGFAAYYLFAEQTDLSTGIDYLTAAIVHLRRALYCVNQTDIPKISYILGKAYYQQGYYYADLAVKYLDTAHNAGLKAPDLAEFRGMAAALLGDAGKAVNAFTEALETEPSDLVLYAVADSYRKNGDVQNAQLYLFETIKKTTDAVLELRCRNQLGFLFLDKGQTKEAFEQFNAVLAKDTNSADAHYGIGLFYELQGDIIKARYEWRKAIRINPLHAETRAKLNIK